MALDAMLGEPRWLWQRWPHPATLMGRAVTWLETRLNRGGNRRAKGAAALAVLVLGAGVLGRVLGAFGWPVEALVLAILLAQRALVEHVGDVAAGLRLSLGDARMQVARIVGRDTAQMTPPEVARAAIESGAENLSDGVVAPLFWFLVAGLPGLLVYKVVNTADSMIGHRTERHAAFGWAAARLDDLLNLIPARLTAGLIAVVHGVWRDWPAITEEAARHRSPNAGWPEAALARALDVALSGPRSYQGRRELYPFVNPGGRGSIGAAEVEAACTALWRVWAAMLAALALGAVVSA
jgi:adenosylcobinamide-phosphate synthase